ncbi:MAG: Mut7-C RNAse domain-containing protein [Syntrophaceae bacterium]
MMGFDTLTMHSWDEDLVQQARHADRIVLTRRASLQGQHGIIFLKSDDLAEQLRQLANLFDLKGMARAFTRCSICNAVLEAIDRHEVKGRVPEFVFIRHERFMRCPLCKKIYWPGTHRDRVEEVFKNVLG